MADEIKRVAEGAVDELLSRYEEGFDSKTSLRVLMSKYLLAERRKAYEECIQIANMVPLEEQHIPAGNYSSKGMNGLVKVVRHGIVNEIRRRMEGVC